MEKETKEVTTMKIEFDADADAMYIYLQPNAEVEETIEMEKGINVDINSKGLPIGIEILSVSRKLNNFQFQNFPKFVATIKPYLSIHEVAILFNVDDETIRRKVKRKEIPAVKIGGRAGYRIESSKLKELENDKCNKKTAAKSQQIV